MRRWIGEASDVGRLPFIALIAGVAAVILGAVVWAPTLLVENDLEERSRSQLTTDELLKAKNDVRTTLLQGVAGGFLLAGLYFTYRTIQVNLQTIQVNREGQITERFTHAIDQLGSEKLDVTLGGIYALERIAKDSRDDHGPVMEVLTAFLREHSRREHKADKTGPSADHVESDDADERPRADLQAAATVIGRRNARNDPPERQLDLSHVRLSGVNLQDAHLEGANLRDTHLERADLQDAHLEGADLRDAHLEGADLRGTHLRSADLRDAHLRSADLRDAHLEGADLRGAGFEGAHFEGADLRGVGFEGAHLQYAHLEGADLRDAHLEGANLRDAHLEGASLQDAHLEGANLVSAHLEGASLVIAHLEGADLRDADNLTPEELKTAFTDETTQVPPNLSAPD